MFFCDHHILCLVLVLVLGLFRGLLMTRIGNGLELHGTIFRLGGKIPFTNLSLNEVPDSTRSTRLRTIPKKFIFRASLSDMQCNCPDDADLLVGCVLQCWLVARLHICEKFCVEKFFGLGSACTSV